MNQVYSSIYFEKKVDVVLSFADLLVDGFENLAGIKGTVRVRVTDEPTLGFIARFGETLEFLDLSEDIEVDTDVEIPIPALECIFEEFEFLDFRDPAITSSVKFSGNLALATRITILLGESRNTLRTLN